MDDYIYIIAIRSDKFSQYYCNIMKIIGARKRAFELVHAGFTELRERYIIEVVFMMLALNLSFSLNSELSGYDLLRFSIL